MLCIGGIVRIPYDHKYFHVKNGHHHSEYPSKISRTHKMIGLIHI